MRKYLSRTWQIEFRQSTVRASVRKQRWVRNHCHAVSLASRTPGAALQVPQPRRPACWEPENWWPALLATGDLASGFAGCQELGGSKVASRKLEAKLLSALWHCASEMELSAMPVEVDAPRQTTVSPRARAQRGGQFLILKPMTTWRPSRIPWRNGCQKLCLLAARRSTCSSNSTHQRRKPSLQSTFGQLSRNFQMWHVSTSPWKPFLKPRWQLPCRHLAMLPCLALSRTVLWSQQPCEAAPGSLIGLLSPLWDDCRHVLTSAFEKVSGPPQGSSPGSQRAGKLAILGLGSRELQKLIQKTICPSSQLSFNQTSKERDKQPHGGEPGRSATFQPFHIF